MYRIISLRFMTWCAMFHRFLKCCWSISISLTGKRERVAKMLSFNFSWRRSLSYINQSIDLLCKLMDWFLYDNGIRHERVKVNELRYYGSTLFVANGTIKKLFWIDWVNIYIFQIFFSIYFARRKIVRLFHITYVAIH